VTASPDAQRRAFEGAFQTLDARIRQLVALPLHTLDAAGVREHLQRIADEVPGQ
jgi:hypothetical protein